MNIKIYGAGQEVGRSCIEVGFNSKRFLFDAGLKITPDVPEFPLPIKDLNKIQALFISHIHLDHTGAIPQLFAKGLRCPIYSSELTKNLLPILLKDSWKIAKIENTDIDYNKEDLFKSFDLVRSFPETNLRSDFYFNKVNVKTFNAGHIPGSRLIYLKDDSTNESVLYTGDVNLTETAITNKFDLDLPSADILIMESTYGGRSHPPRDEVEEEFIEEIKTTLKNKGVVLIPTFSIGRAQELIEMLDGKIDAPIYLDGMAKKITREYLKKDYFVKDFKKLESAVRRVKFVETSKERDSILRPGVVIITTSGMLDGGPVLSYIPKIAKDGNSSILMTGYQAEKTNGRLLLNSGFVVVDGNHVTVDCYVKNHDFSGHASSSQLLQIAKSVNPKLIVLVHGDPEQQSDLKRSLEELGFVVTIPKIGDSINFKTNLDLGGDI